MNFPGQQQPMHQQMNMQQPPYNDSILTITEKSCADPYVLFDKGTYYMVSGAAAGAELWHFKARLCADLIPKRRGRLVARWRSGQRRVCLILRKDVRRISSGEYKEIQAKLQAIWGLGICTCRSRVCTFQSCICTFRVCTLRPQDSQLTQSGGLQKINHTPVIYGRPSFTPSTATGMSTLQPTTPNTATNLTACSFSRARQQTTRL